MERIPRARERARMARTRESQTLGRLAHPWQWMHRCLQLQLHLQLELHLQLHLHLQPPLSPNPNRNNHHLHPNPRHILETSFIPT